MWLMKFRTGFSEKDIDSNPFKQFSCWYSEHINTGVPIPESFSLATSTPDGRVSLRTVLLKDHSERGFIFFTNYNSRKGEQLSSNSFAALLFYWSESGRQVRIEGVAAKVSEEESLAYFRTRPRESQLSAWASEQSRNVPDRAHLESRFETYRKKFMGKDVEKPPHWGGFVIVPSWFEFWQDGEHRLHDRITYSKKDDHWLIQRLAP
jgi:pyridoxamine 5'-phosphate oxidase